MNGTVTMKSWLPTITFLAAMAISLLGPFARDAAADERLIVNTSHTSSITATAYDSGQEFLFTGGRDGAVRVWDLQNRELHRNIQVSHRPVRSITVRPDKPEIAVVTETPNAFRLSLWDVRNAQERFFREVSEVPRHMTYSPQGSFLVYTKTAFDSVRTVDPDTGEELDLVPGGLGIVTFVSVGSSENTIMTYNTANGTITYLDLNDKSVVQRARTRADIEELTLMPNARYAVGLHGNDLLVVDVVEGNVIATESIPGLRSFAVSHERNEISALVHDEDGAAAIRRFRLIDQRLSEGSPLSAPGIDEAEIVAYAAGDLFVGGEQGTIARYAGASGEPAIFAENTLRGVRAVSYGNQVLHVLSGEGRLRALESDFFQPSHVPRDAAPTRVADLPHHYYQPGADFGSDQEQRLVELRRAAASEEADEDQVPDEARLDPETEEDLSPTAPESDAPAFDGLDDPPMLPNLPGTDDSDQDMRAKEHNDLDEEPRTDRTRSSGFQRAEEIEEAAPAWSGWSVNIGQDDRGRSLFSLFVSRVAPDNEVPTLRPGRTELGIVDPIARVTRRATAAERQISYVEEHHWHEGLPPDAQMEALPDGNLIIWSNSTGAVYRAIPERRTLEQLPPDAPSAFRSVTLADGRLTVTGDDGIVYVLDSDLNAVEHEVQIGGTLTALYSRDDEIIIGRNAGGSIARALVRVDVDTGETVGLDTRAFYVFSLAYDAHAEALYSLGLQRTETGVYTVLERHGGERFSETELLARLHAEDLEADIAIDPVTGFVYAAVGYEGILFWDGVSTRIISTGEHLPRRLLIGHGTLAAVNANGSVTLWDVHTREHLVDFYFFRDDRWAALSPHARYLTSDGTAMSDYIRYLSADGRPLEAEEAQLSFPASFTVRGRAWLRQN